MRHGLDAAESVEELGLVCLRYPHSAVADRDGGHVAVASNFDVDVGARRRVFRRVAEQVADDDLKTVRVDVGIDGLMRQVDLEVVAAEKHPHALDGRLGELDDVGALFFQGETAFFQS